jgi:hypothetical protein
MSKTSKYVANLAELSRLEGVARSTATRWDAAGHVVRLPDGRIDVSATRRLVQEGTRDPGAAAARRRLIEARASREEIRLARDRGQVADLRLVGAVWQRVIGNFRSRMLALPRKAVPQLKGVTGDAKKEAVIKDLVYEALTELSETDYGSIVEEEGGKIVGQSPAVAAPDESPAPAERRR